MPEYTYLLDHRLSAAQQNALAQVRDAAREHGMTAFLAGGAVRDLTTGSSVRDLDFAVQGNALDLEEALTARGGTLWGKHEASRTMFFWFPGSVRVEVASTRSERFPKPGQPEYTWNSIVDDLHRRDFTANAMALSLNEGSYGLLLDPLNGVADIEARQLRLVSNYGFLEDPSRLLRAIRLSHRLGWALEERTATRYENAKEADNFQVVSPFLRGYELEEIAAEEDALPVLRKLEAEGWMAQLMPAWTVAAADTAALENLHRNRIQLLMQGVTADLTAAHLEVLTAGLTPENRQALKAAMARPGLLAQWEGLDAAAKEFARLLTSKEAAAPSATWKLFHAHAGEPILWLAQSRKTPAVEAKYKNFLTVWPEAAKKVPVAMMLEMRITPELPVYPELLHELFLQEIDGKLETDEQMRAFLEAYSPPAPPPPVTVRRSRSKKADKGGKRKGAARDAEDEDEDERPASRGDEDEDESEEEDDDLGSVAALGASRDAERDADEAVIAAESADDAEDADVDEDEESAPVAAAGRKPTPTPSPKLDLDKVDLSAVLSRIVSDDDTDADTETETDTGADAGTKLEIDIDLEPEAAGKTASQPVSAPETPGEGRADSPVIRGKAPSTPGVEGRKTAKSSAAPSAAATEPDAAAGNIATPTKSAARTERPAAGKPGVAKTTMSVTSKAEPVSTGKRSSSAPVKPAKPAAKKTLPERKSSAKAAPAPAPGKAAKPASRKTAAGAVAQGSVRKGTAPGQKTAAAPAKSSAKKAAPVKPQKKLVAEPARKQPARGAAKAVPGKKSSAKPARKR